VSGVSEREPGAREVLSRVRCPPGDVMRRGPSASWATSSPIMPPTSRRPRLATTPHWGWPPSRRCAARGPLPGRARQSLPAGREFRTSPAAPHYGGGHVRW